MPSVNPLYRAWALANGLAELLGLGGTALVVSVLRATSPPGAETPARIVGAALLLVFLGTVCEGVLVGWLQGAVLRRPLGVAVARRRLVVGAIHGVALVRLIGSSIITPERSAE
ncbi:MAG TPA: hypothetical protein VF041_06035 [Gemmatimonadaceae bacterium]